MTAARRRPPSLTVEEYRAIVRELLALSGARTSIEARSQDRLVLALAGLEFAVVESAHAVLALDAAGLHNAVAVHVRKCLEFAVVAQWIHVTPDGLVAFEFESRRNTSHLLDEGRSANIDIPEELAAEFSGPARPAPDEAKVMRQFQKVAATFGPASGIYLMYRSLSGECHPNVTAIVRHLENAPDSSGGVGLHLTGGEPSAAWYFTLAASLLWAARPVDQRTKFKPHQAELKVLSRRLGVSSQLKPVPASTPSPRTRAASR